MLPITSTIISYNAYLDGGLFANAAFPASIDKELVVDTILLNAGEFEPLYKDAEFMQHACEVWAKKWYHAFERWALALSEEYNPLHNYDRWEEIEEEHDDATTNKLDASTSTKDTNTNKRSAFDSNNYEPHDQSQLDGSGTSKSDASGTDKGRIGGRRNKVSGRERHGLRRILPRPRRSPAMQLGVRIYDDECGKSGRIWRDRVSAARGQAL